MRPAILCTALLAVPVLAAPAAAHTYGACAVSLGDRCERWSARHTAADTQPPYRSDQFTKTVVAGTTTTYAVLSDTSIDTRNPYDSPGRWLVVAQDAATGAVRWRVSEAERHYLSPRAASLSPDGATLYVTGAAYDGYVIGATDSRFHTVAYDAATGARRWTASWDARPDATDNGNYLAVSPDGRVVYVAGVTTAVGGGLDYALVAYRASDGRELWDEVWSGPRPGGQDAVFGLGVSPDGSTVVMTGWSDGPVEFDTDYATVAYRVRGNRARLAWVARYDGVGANRSDRAMALTVAGGSVFVTGDSYAGTGGASYDYATVAYDLGSGAPQWTARYSGGRGGFNSPRAIAAAGGLVVVTGQASGTTAEEGNDAGTVAYDALTGAERWRATWAPSRHDDYGRDVALSPDGSRAYVVATDIPIVSYTSLDTVGVVAYDTATGAPAWQSRLDAGAGNALSASAVAVSPDGATVVLGADEQRSASPLEGPAQDVYDAVVVAYDR